MPRPEVGFTTELLYASLYPQTIEDEENDWHLLKFVNALCEAALEPVHEIVGDRDEYPGWAVLFDVDNAPVAQLPYLAQFVGVELEDRLTEQEQRDKIRERPAQARGRPATIRSAAQQRLTGSKIVVMFERFEDKAYKLFIRTYTQQTPDAAATLSDILAQKPAGIVLDYDSIEGNPYAITAEEYATYGDRTATGKTYAEISQPEL